jgi:hypothetical protein
MKKIILTLVFFISVLILTLALGPIVPVEAQSNLNPKILTTSGPGEVTRLQAYSKATTDGANSLLSEDITGLFPDSYLGGAGIVPLDQNNNGVLDQFLLFAIHEGGPQALVRGLKADGSISSLGQMFVFDSKIRDGLSAISGDFDNDGYQDDAAFCLTGDKAPIVRIYKDVSGIDNWELINEFRAPFGNVGCNLGTFQYDTGADELLVTPNHGLAEPKVYIYTVGGTLKKDFWAYDAPINQGISSTGIGDRIYTTPNNGSSQVNAFDKEGTRKNFWWVYEEHVRGDFSIRSGQLDTDDPKELLISPVGSNGPHILGYNPSGIQKPTPNFFAFGDETLRNGVGMAVIENWHGRGNSSDNSDDSSDGSDSGSTNSTNLQPDDLTYQGAFRLPSDFDWGARGMSLYSQNNTNYLLVTGPDGEKAYFGRVTIPSPVKAGSWNSLSQEASIVTNLTDFGASIVNSVDPDTAWVSGLEYVPKQGSQSSGKLYGSIDNWYGVSEESHSTVWFSNTDGSSPRGPFHVGSPQDEEYHGNKSGDYLFTVPNWYANQYLGGRTLMTGKSRGSSYGSQGPSLLAFDPADSDNPSGNLDALSVLYYRIKNECASPDVTNKAVCDFPDYTFCDKWEGGSFVENGDKRAIIIYGEKGLGNNNYGEPPAGSCVESKGYYCDPQERQVLFYDVDQIGEAAQGERDPWSVTPYKTWRPDEFFLGDSSGHTCGQAGDMTYDSDNKLLYIIEKGCGDNNSAAVHVYRVN